MKKKLFEMAKRYAETTEFPQAVYFSTTVPDARYNGKKYFFKYCNTHAVAESFKTLKELQQFLVNKGMQF